MMLSIFSYVCLPSIFLLWEMSVYFFDFFFFFSSNLVMYFSGVELPELFAAFAD